MQRTFFVIIALSLTSAVLEASELGGSITGSASSCPADLSFGPQDAVLGKLSIPSPVSAHSPT